MARQMLRSIALDSQSEIAGVASREKTRAERFAAEHGVPRAFASYSQAIESPTTDIVYIATSNSAHADLAERCLRAGKAVLCEKPLACNAVDAQRLINLSSERGCLLMEAMWMRHLPAFHLLLEVLHSGEIGTPRHIGADFGFTPTFDPTSRLFDPDLGGGCLLDLGVYPIALAVAILGPVKATVTFSASRGAGVEEHVQAAVAFEGGGTMEFTASFCVPTPQHAHIYGSNAMITVESPFWRMQGLTIRRIADEPSSLESPYLGCSDIIKRAPYAGNGYIHTVREAVACWSRGAIESAMNRHSDSLETLRAIDAIKEELDRPMAQKGKKIP